MVVQTVTSSVDFVTGSTRFGSTTGNNHQFTGSVLISGSQTINGLLTGANATFTGNISGSQANLTATANTYAGSTLKLNSYTGGTTTFLTSVPSIFALSVGGGADHLLISSSVNFRGFASSD